MELLAGMHSYPEPLVAAVLTGGTSRRMGQAKHDLRCPDGRRLIDLVVDACRGVTTQIVICGPPDILPDRPHVDDRVPGQGPLAAIEALLASGHGTRYLVVPCDMPALASDDLRRLADADHGLAVFREQAGDPPHSLPMLIASGLSATVSARLASDDRSLQGLLQDVDAIRVEPPPARRLRNINTPEEWAEWCGSRTDG